MADQAIVSFGRFAASIILARHLPSSQYGVFVLLLTVGFSAQRFTQGLSGYPSFYVSRIRRTTSARDC